MKKRSLLFCMLFIITLLSGEITFAGGVKDGQKKIADNSNSPSAESYLHSLRANQKTNSLNPIDLVNAIQDVNSMSASRSANPLEWTSLGPDNFGGKTTAIVYDNRDASGNTVFAGSVGGGVWKSVNDGITWQAVSDLSLMVSWSSSNLLS